MGHPCQGAALTSFLVLCTLVHGYVVGTAVFREEMALSGEQRALKGVGVKEG